MTSKPVSALLVDLGVTRSHSRPRVSNDCPLLRSAVQDDEVPLRLPPILRHRPGRANVSVKDSSPSTTTFIAIPGSDGIPLLRSTSAPLAPSTRPARSPSTRPRPRTQNGSPAAQCHHESPSSPGSTNPNQNYRTPDHRTVSLDLTDTDMCRLELCRMRNPLRNDEDRVCARSLALSCLSRSGMADRTLLEPISVSVERSPNAVTAPAHGHSNASATIATASRNAAKPAAPATPAQPPSESTPSNPEQPDRNYATWHCAMKPRG